MVAIISEYMNDYRHEIPIEWDNGDIREAASILSGVTSIEAENVIAALIAAPIGSAAKAVGQAVMWHPAQRRPLPAWTGWEWD